MTQAPTIAKHGASPIENLADVSDFWILLKPRVMSLSIFTALVGLTLAPGSLHPVLAFSAILFIAMGAGASGALNMWFEGTIDGKMLRTKNRPIPAGRMDKGVALGFGLVLGVASVVLMGLVINWLTASLLALTIFFYVVIYTIWLKPRTPQNIVIGGAAGALPPVVGWAAVTGSVGIEPMVLFAIIFAWTPAHFWALALLCKDEYARAGLPMLPNVKGTKTTCRNIFAYTIMTVGFSFLPFILGFSGPLYASVAGLFGLMFIARAAMLLANQDNVQARKVFLFSILYLFAVWSSLMVDYFVMERLI